MIPPLLEELSNTHRRYLPLLLLLLLTLPSGAAAQDGPQVTLIKSAYPTTVPVGGRVTYTITLANSGSQAAQGLTVRDSLPEGFSYAYGTSRITLNGVTISTADPAMSGTALTWSGLRLPAGRSDSFYGIHTFVQSRWNPCDHGYIDYQLQRSRELMGVGSYVTQLFDWIEPDWQGPLDCWKEFVSKAYDLGLTPVVRLAGPKVPSHWIKPKPDADGRYASWAHAFMKVVEGLPRRDGHYLYVQVWNEPNLDEEWEGQANPTEYGRFLVDSYNAIRSLGDPRIIVLNGPLSPGGGYDYLDFVEDMLDREPDALWAFDVWASHPYPGNRPPEYNFHDGTAGDDRAAIDLYQHELEILAQHGRSGVKVLLTETGYALFNLYDVVYPAINEANRADYIRRAFRDYWSRWPEVIGVCPYELVDPEGQWWVWDWLPSDGQSHQQYDAVRAMDKSYSPVSSVLRISFQATAPGLPGTYYNDVSAAADNAYISPANDVAPVQVYIPTPTATPTTSPTPTSTPTPTPTPTGTLTPVHTLTATVTQFPSPTPTCIDLILNGGFEVTEAWQISDTPHPAAYTTAQAHSGERSMRLGIAAGDNIRTYSSIWQAIAVPADAPDPVLTFWYYAVSDDVVGDRQYALIQDEGGSLESVFSDRSDEQVWTYREYSLAAFKGHNVRIYFGVFNDGEAGITSMYVDDVAVVFCPSRPTPTVGTPTASPTPSTTPTATDTPTATPSATPTPTNTQGPTPSPTVTTELSPTPPCQDLVVDGGFEWDDEAWYIPVAGRADYSTVYAHGGQRSMRVGIESGENVYSYSTVQQTVHVPADAQEAVLSFWYYAVSGDTENDLQYVLVKDQEGSFEWVLEERSNGQVWTFMEHHLGSRYRGTDISLYFSVLNDGSAGTTVMYVDDVSLLICGAQPTPSSTPGTFPAALFLPVIVRQYTEEGPLTSLSSPENGYGETDAGQPALAPTSFSGVRTLWAPAGSQVAPDFVGGVALSPVEGTLYVAAGESLWLLDAQSGGVIGQIPVGAAARGLAVDVAASRIYAALPDADALVVINASRRLLWKTVPGIPGASGVAIDGDHVYVTATGSDELVVVDRENYAIIKRLTVGDAPYAVACDPERQWVYIGNAGDDTVSIVDGRSGRVLNTAELDGLGHPHGLALDPSRARLYVTYAFTPKYQAVASIDAVSGQVLSRLVGNDEQPLFGAYGIAVDTLLGRVYVTAVEGLLVLKGETLQVVGLLPGVGPAYAFGLHLDPVHQQLYVVDGGRRRLAVCGI